jgi:sigma-B regulation protein RsbU (phosphoserine phosphatase)
LPDETYGPSRAFALDPGDILVLLTDGVFEWRNQAGTQFGIERLSQSIGAAAHQSAKQIVDAIDRGVRDFAAGAPQTDDFTVVVIKRTP